MTLGPALGWGRSVGRADGRGQRGARARSSSKGFEGNAALSQSRTRESASNSERGREGGWEGPGRGPYPWGRPAGAPRLPTGELPSWVSHPWGRGCPLTPALQTELRSHPRALASSRPASGWSLGLSVALTGLTPWGLGLDWGTVSPRRMSNDPQVPTGPSPTLGCEGWEKGVGCSGWRELSRARNRDEWL